MKTILYNPIFINPQAYYVFPRLTRYLQPDNESTSEPANYIGTIEVEVIAYGDTTLKRTYTNTDSIDLSEFKNTWIRISLFTKVGSCVLGEWKIGNMESDLPYIDPEVLASLKAVVIVGNKTNNDSDRAIVKNLVDPDNPFVISNAAYTEGSGYADKGSPYYGAFVTDGIDDLITSTKTVQEMLGGSNEITVVSMIHLVQTPSASSEKAYTNQIRTGQNYLRNYVTNNGKTGIYGYTYKGNNVSVINNILGDKNDYTVENKSWNNLAKFSVIGYEDNGTINELDQVAWYWTIIANKVLTTDQINQVIAYFNLDRTLKPDILCNTIKQGITNENHAEFGDKLIDFSGNGRDIQLNNIAWKGDSGIGKYAADFTSWTTPKEVQKTSDTVKITTEYTEHWVAYLAPNNTFKSMKVLISGIPDGGSLQFFRTTADGGGIKMVNGINEIPEFTNTVAAGFYIDVPLGFDWSNLVIEQIPSHAGALCLDGVNDFGKVTGMPIYKDYTVVADRELYNGKHTGAVVSKAYAFNNGSFYLESLVTVASFGGLNDLAIRESRFMSYQSKYIYNGNPIQVGTGVDSDSMWIGKLRDGDSRFSKLALWSLMLFPYSLSEFLLERQLKKHKLGTLYPDMVEFRPVINSNVLLDSKPTFVIRGTSTHLNAGDYVPENSQIWVSIKMNNIADRITKFTVNGKTIDIPENAYSEVTLQYGFPFVIDKSPQKIGITIEQDENYVLFNPVITSNVEYHRLDFYLNNYQKRINIGDYIPKDAYLRANFYLKNNVDELTVFTFNGVNIDYRRSIVDDTAFNIGPIYNYDSPQEVNITIDEYIKYENIDFTNCYPGVPRIYVNDKSVTWGNKLKVGDEFTFYGNVNILPEMYNVLVKALYNGEEMVYGSIGTISKSMVFTSFKTYLLDNNEPKCILSPRLLRIPNSSYKILGHIPDISGHGNHGKINNSAYAGASGANGYLQNFSEWTKASGVSSTDSVISSSNNLVAANGWIAYVTSGTVIPTFKVEISGIPVNGNLRFEGSDQTLVNGVNTIQGITTTKVTGFYISSGYDNDWSNLKIEQIGEYEGAYCFDGVDDFVTIPTTVGGKQVLMKVNWDSPNASILYDQRGYNNEFAIYNGTNDSDGNPIPAYQGRNNGQTYIDGILNSNIKASELRAITHNITITNELSSGANKIYPIIGSSKSNAYFVNMALYDFMLFDEISTDDKILELNEYVGIEGNIE